MLLKIDTINYSSIISYPLRHTGAIWSPILNSCKKFVFYPIIVIWFLKIIVPYPFLAKSIGLSTGIDLDPSKRVDNTGLFIL